MSSSDSEEVHRQPKRLRPADPEEPIDPSLPGKHDLESQSYFSQLVRNTPLPPSGPEYFAARRELWLTPPYDSHSENTARDYVERITFQEPLGESTWKNHLEPIYNLLMAGRALRRNMSMEFIVRIIYAGWIHNGLWPKGVSVDDFDEFLGNDAPIYNPRNSRPEPLGPS